MWLPVMLSSPPSSTPGTDPNWLLSSTAQSAAALVAIVGGFLVSRLITLSGERNVTIQRRDELRDRLQIKQSEYNEIHADRFSVSREWFLESHQDELLSASGDVEVPTLLQSIPRGSSEEEMRPFAESLPHAVKEAFERIEEQFPDDQPIAWAAEALRSAGLEFPWELASVYEMVAKEISKRRTRSYIPDLGFKAGRPDIVYQRQDARIDLERQLSGEIRALAAELALIENRLAAFRKPEGLTGAVMALTYLTIVGIVLPTTLMALRPVPDGPVIRIAVVIAFVSGLIVLLGYFVFRARSLRYQDDSVPMRRKRIWAIKARSSIEGGG